MLRLFTIFFLAGANVCFGDDYTLTPAVVDDKTGNMANGKSEITWSSLPDVDAHTSGEAKEPHGGWRTYYSLMHSFVSSVFSQGLPNDLIIKAVKMDDELLQNYQSYTKYIIGYAICGGVGIIFTLVFPFVSCCFCCCRCAGKCGGKRKQSDDDARNFYKKNVFTVIVIITTAFLGVGMAAILDNNDKMSDALTGTGETFKDNIDDVRQYLNNTVQQVERVVIDDIDFMEAVITRDLDNVAFLVGVPLRQRIEARTDIRNTLTNAYRLSSDLITVDTSLREIDNSFNVLEQSVTDMENKLSTIRTDLAQIFSACISCPTPPDISALTPGVDSTKFPDISGQITSVNEATKTNLTEKIVDAEAELDGIPKRVQDDSEKARNDTKKEISKLKGEIDPIITEFRDINDAVNEDASSIDDIETDIETYADLIRPYDQYRSYGSFGMFGVVLVVVIGNCLGIILGVLGGSSKNEPHERGCSSNSAGCLLMVSAGVVLSISTIFMLLTTLTFVLGAPLEMIVCNNLRDLEKVQEPLIDKLETGLADTDRYIQNNASDDINVLLAAYANRLLGVVDSYVAHAESAVKTEIGKCEPVWNVYESIFIHTLCGGIVDALNGFWFSLGWCVFFFLPSLVFSVKLAKYFRRMEAPPSDSYNQPGPQNRQISIADQWLRRNKVYHHDDEKDW